MSITVEKLSLLDSLAPLRQSSDNAAQVVQGGFSERFDRALGGDIKTSNGADRVKALAESLTLQMLQTSLALTGDSSMQNPSPQISSLSSTTKALLQAYRDNLAEGGELAPPQQIATPPSPPSQIRDLADVAPATAPAAAPSSSARSGSSWLEPIILKASRKYGVDVGLIKAVINAESGFNPQAVSHAGARGLMQLMPATARSLGVSDSFDPEQNVMGGTRFLKDMLQRYNGNVDAALAAYNWGPGNVDRRPDQLPRETRNYLARVKQLYASYGS